MTISYAIEPDVLGRAVGFDAVDAGKTRPGQRDRHQDAQTPATRIAHLSVPNKGSFSSKGETGGRSEQWTTKGNCWERVGKVQRK